jgi:hypothetical protein
MAMRLNQPLNRDEYQECFLRGNSCQCVGLPLPPSHANCLKSGNLNHLELSGPVQRLHFTVHIFSLSNQYDIHIYVCGQLYPSSGSMYITLALKVKVPCIRLESPEGR